MRKQESGGVYNPASQHDKRSEKVVYARSISCHHLGNQLHPRDHAGKSQSEVNLARLAVDKHAGKRSPTKHFQKLENRDSLASIRSLNSFLSVCEGMDADYMVEDDPLLDIEPDGDDGKPLDATPKLQQQQSVATDLSLNSLLTLAEEDTSGIEVDRPTIIIKGPEDSDEEPVKESESLIEKRRSGSTDLPAGKRERRGGTGRTTSDEKSQTGRVSLHNVSRAGLFESQPFNANPGLKVNQSIDFSCIKLFFNCFSLLMFCVV